MPRDPQVDLVLAHMTPRYVATGVDANDLQRIAARIQHWNDWCRIWSAEAALHAAQAEEAAAHNRHVTASEANLRAASGPTDFVVFEEGNHVCFNISYKFRSLSADWTAEHLGVVRADAKSGDNNR